MQEGTDGHIHVMLATKRHHRWASSWNAIATNATGGHLQEYVSPKAPPVNIITSMPAKKKQYPI